MKIIKEGKTYNNISWTIFCSVCNSNLEVSPEDVERYILDDPREPDNFQDYLECQCPVCKQNTFVVHWNDVPKVAKYTVLKNVKIKE